MQPIAARLANEFNKNPKHVESVIALIDEGNTIPFIARYRKEMTGSMDDTTLRDLGDRLAYLRNLESRREDVRAAITELEKMTDEIAAALDAAEMLSEIEDIYRPYKPKRKTRASVARSRGLEPLAALLLEQQLDETALVEQAAQYIDAENGVEGADAALAGARDIVAEDVSDDAEIRKKLRALAFDKGVVSAAATKDEDSVYRMYYDYAEPVAKIQSHRVLAVNRGEREEFLRVSVELPEADAQRIVFFSYVKNDSAAAKQVEIACEDALARLILPSVEREVRGALTESANEQAIKMFGVNLRPLLMQPPVKNKVVMGVDPAYRTGCKIAVVGPMGDVLDTAVVYPTPPNNKTEESAKTLGALIKKHGVEIISIGNGTASHETEVFIAALIHGTPLKYMVVSEAGASVYSASKLAAAEFPNYDVSLRSAVSIARRLQDPLAELVKIDPKSIGVGQYQHDMPQARLGETLAGVVEDCVNAVGVDANTASAPLLQYVAGVSAAVAKNIVAYREENGAFIARKQLREVPKLGDKSFEQCAGFLRVPESQNPLDNTGVHPESYAAAKKLLALCGHSLADVTNAGLPGLYKTAEKLGFAELARECGVGEPTLRDIVAELQKPGRDPRDELPPPLLRSDVMGIEDLKPGMELMGTVRNVVDFGAFVDIGVHEDGLVHISQLADRYVKHPSDVVKTGDIVTVRVLGVEPEKNRISLTMRKQAPETKEKSD